MKFVVDRKANQRNVKAFVFSLIFVIFTHDKRDGFFFFQTTDPKNTLLPRALGKISPCGIFAGYKRGQFLSTNFCEAFFFVCF
jgi:hypothetical protein